MFETNSTNQHGDIVCRKSMYKNNPCGIKACKHHVCHVKASQSGTEYLVRKPSEVDNCIDRYGREDEN